MQKHNWWFENVEGALFSKAVEFYTTCSQAVLCKSRGTRLRSKIMLGVCILIRRAFSLTRFLAKNKALELMAEKRYLIGNSL
jgi:hypothetical protein